MNKTLLASLLATACLPLALLAQDKPVAAKAQEAAAPRSEEALAVLKRSAEAMKQLKTVSYQVRQEVFLPPDEGMKPPVTEGLVLLRRVGSDDPMGAHIKITGRISELPDGGEATFTIGYDGEMARVFFVAPQEEKVMWEAKIDAGGKMLLEFADRLLVSGFSAENPLEEQLKAEEIKLLPEATVGDVVCTVVEIGSDKGSRRTQIAVGKSDHLPRQLTDLIPRPSGEVSLVLTLSDLKTGVELGEKSLLISAPEGFEVRKFEPPEPEPELLAVGSMAPDWTLADPNGKAVKLSDLRGKVVVMDFWATWCPPCKKAMPSVQKLHERFEGKPVAIYGLSTWEKGRGGDPVAYMRDNKFTYGLLIEADEVAKTYAVSGIPTLYLIGPDGKILHSEVGFDEDMESKLGALIEAALAGK